MAGPNTNNVPDPDDLVFGRGEVYAAVLDDDDEHDGGWVHLGNCPEFAPNFAIEKAEHFSSMSGLKVKDRTTIIQASGSLKFKLQEFNEFNLARFLLADIATFTNPAVAGFAEINQKYPSVTLGRWYDLSNSAGVRCYDISDSTKILLEKDAGSDVALVEGTDYELDKIWGRFRLLPTATHIATGDNANLTVTAGASATSAIRRIQALTTVGSKYAIKFIFKNANNEGKQLHVQFHKVDLEPSGDLALITNGNDYAAMDFEGGCEESTNPIYADSPTLSIDWHAAA